MPADFFHREILYGEDGRWVVGPMAKRGLAASVVVGGGGGDGEHAVCEVVVALGAAGGRAVVVFVAVGPRDIARV